MKSIPTIEPSGPLDAGDKGSRSGGFRARLLIAVAAIALFAVASGGEAHGISAADREAMLEGGYFQYVRLGAAHMLTGYDHLLFLFGVVFFLRKFGDIVKFVTAFTIGHSITLIFATLAMITADYYLVDAVIALSVCYKGFDNNDGFRRYLGVKAPNLLAAVFVFGLIHGFGLSTRLQQMPLGEEGLILRILSFNLGVELGQITALTGMVAVLSYWRRHRSFAKFSTAANNALIAAGALLFLMQMHGYSHSTAPEAFAFNDDAHFHAHDAMSVARVVADHGGARGVGRNVLDDIDASNAAPAVPGTIALSGTDGPETADRAAAAQRIPVAIDRLAERLPDHANSIDDCPRIEMPAGAEALAAGIYELDELMRGLIAEGKLAELHCPGLFVQQFCDAMNIAVRRREVKVSARGRGALLESLKRVRQTASDLGEAGHLNDARRVRARTYPRFEKALDQLKKFFPEN